MKNFIIYNSNNKILRTGTCTAHDFLLQAGKGEFVLEGTANDITQKISEGKVVNKTPEEIEIDNPTPPEIPFEKQTARITNEQWQAVLNRLDKLEGT